MENQSVKENNEDYFRDTEKGTYMAKIVQALGVIQCEQSPDEHYFPHWTQVNFIPAEIMCIKFPSCPEYVPSLALRMTSL